MKIGFGELAKKVVVAGGISLCFSGVVLFVCDSYWVRCKRDAALVAVGPTIECDGVDGIGRGDWANFYRKIGVEVGRGYVREPSSEQLYDYLDSKDYVYVPGEKRYVRK